MREIVLDIESTGLSVSEGHRVIEIGCVELVNRRPAKTFHVFLNPERPIEPGATRVHGITDERVKNEPVFADVVDDFCTFIDGAKIVAHNASFDFSFVNNELNLAEYPETNWADWIDTYQLAVAKFGRGKGRNTLNALCTRFGIDTSHRTQHGALLDAQLLADVYFELTDEKQKSLILLERNQQLIADVQPVRQRIAPVARHVGPSERAAHRAFVAELSNPIWGDYLEPERMAA